jgi:ribosome biogenesis GTPase
MDEAALTLADWGWDAAREDAFAEHREAGLEPGRVITANAGGQSVMTADGERFATPSGRLRHAATSGADMPSVGDWVALNAEIESVLPRRSAFLRSSPARPGEAQVLAANVDSVLLVSALTRDLNMRRLERYLGAAWASGAAPVVVLSKSDLCLDLPAAMARVSAVAVGVPILAISALTGDGLDALRVHLVPQRTLAILGSSGVGKSTLVNTLLGSERQAVRETRHKDERGRHQTSARELVVLPGGALVIDTPGLRSLALWDESGLDRAFEDIAALAEGCRFRDCAHGREPGCAVQAAIAAGTLSAARLANRGKLERELRSIARRSTPGSSRAANRAFGRMTRQPVAESGEEAAFLGHEVHPRTLALDGRGRAVAGHHAQAGLKATKAGDRSRHLLRRAAFEVDAAPTAGEERVAAEEDALFGGVQAD